MPMSITFILNNFKTLAVKFHFTSGIFGFFILLTMASQLLSGIMLAFSLIPEPMLIPIVRDEEDLEDLYTDDFFWLHERGVDLIFIFSYFHLFRKFYLNLFYIEQEFAWKSGVFTFMIFQVVTFLGLVLCCTHLSEITLNIACNIMYTFFAFTGKPYWWIFTNNTLNSDTVVRLAYAHYLSAFYLFFLGFLHALDMHYDWKTDYNFEGLEGELLWFDEALVNELYSYLKLLLLIFITGLYLYHEPEALSYEIFMWGDVGAITDIRFYGVAPHWYFRPFMAWLTVCPFHLTGIGGLLLFFFLLYFQPVIMNVSEFGNLKAKFSIFGVRKVFQKTYSTIPVNNEFFLSNQIMFYTFVWAMLYTTTFLPAGRYYQRVFGNEGMLLSYLYIFCYLTFYRIRALWIQETTWHFMSYNLLKLKPRKRVYINYFEKRTNATKKKKK